MQLLQSRLLNDTYAVAVNIDPPDPSEKLVPVISKSKRFALAAEILRRTVVAIKTDDVPRGMPTPATLHALFLSEASADERDHYGTPARRKKGEKSVA